jgi:flavin-binding protein dodecin
MAQFSLAQCDFYDDINVDAIGFNSSSGYTQKYVLVSSSSGLPGNIISINNTGIFTSVPEGSYFIYAVNYSGITPGSLTTGTSWDTFVTASASMCINISTSYLNREIYVCNLNTLCAPNLIQASTNGYNSSYTQFYALCNGNSNNILAFNSIGVFDETDYNNQAGIYTVYALNTNDLSIINAVQVGVNFTSIQNLENTECVEISTPKAFNIQACTPLPIGLIDFKASKIDQTVKLTWTSSSEINNDFYTIEKTADFENWEEVSKVEGAGNSSTILHYQTIDLFPWNGTSYYRLKQTDYNGAFSYHGIETIIFDEGDELSVFPNPTSGSIQLRASKTIKQVRVFSVINQLVTTFDDTNLIDLENLSAGTYVLEVVYEDQKSEKIKVILTH